MLLVGIFYIVFLRHASGLDLQDEYLYDTFKVVYWEVEPYIFRDNNNRLAGKMVTRLDSIKELCSGRVNYTKGFTSYDAFKRYLYRNVTYEDHGKETLWGPIITSEKLSVDFFYDLNVFPVYFETITEMAVIVPQSRLSLHEKLFSGLHKLYFVLLLALVACLLTGTLLWITELRYNPGNSTYRQLEDSFWWAFITMSTVGYGDIAPKRLTSRLIAIIWMYVALIVPCVLTATTSSLVFGLDTFDIDGKRVAVLKQSFEKDIASDVYKTINVEYDSYEQVMQAVRDGNVFAGLVNQEVATWYQNEKRKDERGDFPLRTVQLLPANIDVYWLISAHLRNGEIGFCAKKHMHTARSLATGKYFRSSQREHLLTSSFFDMFVETYQFLLATVSVLLLSVVIYFVLERRYESKTKRTYQPHNDYDILSDLRIMKMQLVEELKATLVSSRKGY